MNKEVELKLLELEALEQEIMRLGKGMHQGYTYNLDILANAVLDRSLHLILGFTTLIRNENYICAVHLVRLHLDNLLRFSGAWLVEDPNVFAKQIMEGEKVQSIKDAEGHLLKDWYLKNKMTERYSWVKSVYDETSGFIHLSSKHVFSSSRLSETKDHTIEMNISKGDVKVADESRLEAIEGMIAISKAIFEYVESWISHKLETMPQ